MRFLPPAPYRAINGCQCSRATFFFFFFYPYSFCIYSCPLFSTLTISSYWGSAPSTPQSKNWLLQIT